MENSKKIQVGLLVLLAGLLVANMYGGGFKSWFGQSEGDKLREIAASMENSGSISAAHDGAVSGSNGNIPGTNVNVADTPTGPTTTIKYDSDRFDFGSTDEGEIVKHVFKFKNTGSEPLVISNAKGSCGCTVPTWPKEPVPPGGVGEIKIEFNTKGKPGRQSKRVTVTGNTVPTETFLEITGEVRGKEQSAAKGK